MAITKTTTYPSVEVNLDTGYIYINKVVTVDDPDDDELPIVTRSVDQKYCNDDLSVYPDEIVDIGEALNDHFPAEAPEPVPPV